MSAAGRPSTRAIAVTALVVAFSSVAAAIGPHLIERRSHRRTLDLIETMSRLRRSHDAVSEQHLNEARERLRKKKLAEEADTRGSRAEGDARFRELMSELIARLGGSS